ncbi:MAG: prepilin-type N-terminal cleavage/methylation domain-containing protein [Pyrinomonadaceae bacterium]
MKYKAQVKGDAVSMTDLVKADVPKYVTPGFSDTGNAAARRRSENGFSLVELLIVVVVIGVIAALAVPQLQKAIRASENGNVFATMRTVSSTQVNFFSQNGRFARLNEINNLLGNGLGTQIGNEVYRNKFVFEMTPAVPTVDELKTAYTITATRDVAGEGLVYKFEITGSGEVRQILPAP